MTSGVVLPSVLFNSCCERAVAVASCSTHVVQLLALECGNPIYDTLHRLLRVPDALISHLFPDVFPLYNSRLKSSQIRDKYS